MANLRRLARWLPDWLIPTLEDRPPSPSDEAKSSVLLPVGHDVAALRLAHSELSQLLAAESDRMKTADTKLLAMSAATPIATTIGLAIVTFLTSGNVRTFTSASVILTILLASYISLNCVIAVRAAVKGLGTRAYLERVPSSLLPTPQATEEAYLSASCQELVEIVVQHRDTTNGKFSQVRLAHRALLNALLGLLIAVLLVAVITVFEAVRHGTNHGNPA